MQDPSHLNPPQMKERCSPLQDVQLLIKTPTHIEHE